MQTSKKNLFITKWFLCFFALLITAIICGVPASTVQAEVKLVNPKQTFYLDNKNLAVFNQSVQMCFEMEVSDGDSIVESSFRSNNENVAQVKAVWKSKDEKTYYLYAGYARYPGTADISFEDQTGKQYTVTAEVLPYENPIESIKVTNIEKGKNFAGKTNKKCTYGTNGIKELLTFSKKTNVPKITVKAKKDWTIKEIYIECAREKYKNTQEYKRWGQKTIRNVDARTKTVKLKKVDKGDGLAVAIVLENNKNGAVQRVSYGYLWYSLF